jgi:hypothetical protein
MRRLGIFGSIALTSCASIQPAEILDNDRITVERAAAEAADAIKAFRLRLATAKLGVDGIEPVVPDQYKSGLLFCKVEIVFTLSAKAGDGGKLTLSVPTVFNFAGPNPPLNTVSPTVGAERTSTAEANRGNSITFSMVNPVCNSFDKILGLVQEKSGSSIEDIGKIIRDVQELTPRELELEKK